MEKKKWDRVRATLYGDNRHRNGQKPWFDRCNGNYGQLIMDAWASLAGVVVEVMPKKDETVFDVYRTGGWENKEERILIYRLIVDNNGEVSDFFPTIDEGKVNDLHEQIRSLDLSGRTKNYKGE